MRPAVLVVGLLLALALASSGPSARSHAPGSPPITASGSFELQPDGTPDATYHAYLSDLGVPPDPGDTLRFSWSANNGLGPAVYFEIHAHPDAASWVTHYDVTAVRIDDSWNVPESSGLMVLWSNPNDEVMNVTYAFSLLAPPDLTVLLVFPAAIAVIAVLFWIHRRQDRGPRGREREDTSQEDSGTRRRPD